MGALCHQPSGLGRQPSGCGVRLLILGTAKAFVAFLASLGWRPSAAPTHYLDSLLMRRSPLRWIIPTFLALQLGLLWIQGAQLHRQNQVLQGLREDIQALTESIENGQSSAAFQDEGEAVPASFDPPTAPPKKVAVLGAEEEQESAAKELKASRESADKAVKEAREAQSKLSIEENARKAEEARKVQAATSSWQGWAWGAFGLVVLALVGRSVIRRRA